MKTIIRSAGAAGLATAVLAMGATAQSADSGMFTADQAARGQSAYFGECAVCHGYDLIKVDGEASDLTGAEFGGNWVGQTLAARHEYIASAMPANDPGSLDDQTVLDIIAYILAENGYAPGDAELTTSAELEAIVLPAVP